MCWKIIALIREFAHKLKEDCVDAHAAQAAFFVILSFIPFLMVLLSMIQYTPVTKGYLLQIVREILPGYITPLVISIIDEVYTKSVGVLSLSAVAAVWSSARGFLSLTQGLNRINHVNETRNYVLLRLRACFYTATFILSIVLSLALMVFGNSLQGLLEEKAPLVARLTARILGARSLIMLTVLVFLFVVIYTFIPNRKAKLSGQIPGAVLCAACWMGFSFFFSVYVKYSAHVSKTYGSLTTVVLVMLWLYICMYIFLACAKVNVCLGSGWVRRRKK